MTTKQTRIIFIVFAIMFGTTAMYHFGAVFFKLNDSTQLRNIVFVVINLVCIYGVLKRPLWFIYFFSVLFIQQSYSHGISLFVTYKSGKMDWISILDLVLLPVILFFLISDLRKKKAGAK